jgi:hypothetical protein
MGAVERLREQERRESLQLLPFLVGALSILLWLGLLVAGLFILPDTGKPAFDTLLWGVYGGGTAGTILILRHVLPRRWDRRQRQREAARLARQF